MGTGLIVLGAAVLLVAITLRKTIIVVRQAQTMVIERLGKYSRSLSSGVNLVVPWFDQPRALDWHQVISLPPARRSRGATGPLPSICARRCTSSRART